MPKGNSFRRPNSSIDYPTSKEPYSWQEQHPRSHFCTKSTFESNVFAVESLASAFCSLLIRPSANTREFGACGTFLMWVRRVINGLRAHSCLVYDFEIHSSDIQRQGNHQKGGGSLI